MNFSERDDAIFSRVEVDGGRIVWGEVLGAEGDGDDETDGQGGQRRITPEKVAKLYSNEKFHRHIVKALGWIGKKKGYQSLQIDPQDEEFRDACETLYDLAIDSGLGPAADLLGDENFERAFVLALGFLPVATGFIGEVMEKKEAAQQAAAVEAAAPAPKDQEQEPEGKGENDHEQQ